MERQRIERDRIWNHCRVVNFAQRRTVIDLERTREQMPIGARYCFEDLMYHLARNDTLMLDSDIWYIVNLATEFGHGT